MTLNAVWFALIAVLFTGYAVLDGFDLGAGALHLLIGKTDEERRVTLNAIGPVWDGNEVWLLTGGGALFAAFPKVYATVFSGFYLAMMLVLLALILRAVSLEFRSKGSSHSWRAFWDGTFCLGSSLSAADRNLEQGVVAVFPCLSACRTFPGHGRNYGFPDRQTAMLGQIECRIHDPA